MIYLIRSSMSCPYIYEIWDAKDKLLADFATNNSGVFWIREEWIDGQTAVKDTMAAETNGRVCFPDKTSSEIREKVACIISYLEKRSLV